MSARAGNHPMSVRDPTRDCVSNCTFTATRRSGRAAALRFRLDRRNKRGSKLVRSSALWNWRAAEAGGVVKRRDLRAMRLPDLVKGRGRVRPLAPAGSRSMQPQKFEMTALERRFDVLQARCGSDPTRDPFHHRLAQDRWPPMESRVGAGLPRRTYRDASPQRRPAPPAPRNSSSTSCAFQIAAASCLQGASSRPSSRRRVEHRR